VRTPGKVKLIIKSNTWWSGSATSSLRDLLSATSWPTMSWCGLNDFILFFLSWVHSTFHIFFNDPSGTHLSVTSLLHNVCIEDLIDFLKFSNLALRQVLFRLHDYWFRAVRFFSTTIALKSESAHFRCVTKYVILISF